MCRNALLDCLREMKKKKSDKSDAVTWSGHQRREDKHVLSALRSQRSLNNSSHSSHLAAYGAMATCKRGVGGVSQSVAGWRASKS